MATLRTFAYNSGAGITGTTQVGYIAAGETDDSYGAGLTWWKGPDEDLGYVICHTSGARTAGRNQYVVPSPTIGFWRTERKTDDSFISFCNSLFGQNFTNAIDTSIWLTDNGYWNSYPNIIPVLYLDAGNTSSYPGAGTTWTDLVGGKTFNLMNGPTYNSADGGKIKFTAASSQYAECSSSLPSLATFTTSVWHYWDGLNTGGLPCILTENYVGSKINYFLGALQGAVAQSGYFNGGFQISPQFTLDKDNWYQIVTTCDLNQVVKVYVNNILISTTSTTGAPPSSSQAGIRLMRRWDNPDYWGGYLSTVQIYDKALDSGQVSSIWNATRSRYGL